MTFVEPGQARAATRQALLVLGMHRSGTSATAGLLIRLGAQGPASLMDPTVDNPLGFSESEAVQRFHERLLHAAGSRWDSWTRFSPSSRDAPIPAELANEFRTLLEQEFGRAPLLVVKDPRMCRLVPFWLRSLESERISAAAIIPVRSPLEVAQSLRARDGIGQEHALLMWLRHVLDAEFETRTIARTFVRYSDLLENWTAAADKIAHDIGLEWPQRSSSVQLEIEQFIDQHLRHHAIGIEALDVASPLGDWVRQTCAAVDLLLEQSTHGAGDPLGALDQVRHALDAATSLFGPLFEDQRRRVASVEAENAALRQHVADIETMSRELRRHAAEFEAEKQNLHQHAANLEAEKQALHQHAANLEAEKQTLHQHAANLEAEKQSLHQHAASLEQHRQDLARELERTRHHVAALLESVSWKMTAPFLFVMRLLMSK